MALASLIAQYLPIGTLAVSLLLLAYHGHEVLALGNKVSTYLRAMLALALLVGILSAAGVLELSVSLEPVLAFVTTALDVLGGLLGGVL